MPGARRPWQGLACAAAAVVALAAGVTALVGFAVLGGFYYYGNYYSDNTGYYIAGWLVLAASCVTTVCAIAVLAFQACRNRYRWAGPHSPVCVAFSGVGLLWSILMLGFFLWLVFSIDVFPYWSEWYAIDQAVFVFSCCIGTAVWVATLIFAVQDRAACQVAANAGVPSACAAEHVSMAAATATTECSTKDDNEMV